MTRMNYDKLHPKNERFHNPRTTTGLSEPEIRELAINIGLHGLFNPLLVLEDGLIVAGQRRHRAIGFLITWFTPGEKHAPILDVTFQEYFGDLTQRDVSIIEATTAEFHFEGVPVKIVADEGLALTENLQRSDLSSYEIAAHLAHMIAQGATQADLVRLIGKSRTYVSRKLGAFNGACTELKDAWANGTLADERVQELAKLTHDEQRKVLAGPIPRGIRGPVNRPGIDTVKEVLGDLSSRVTKSPRNEKEQHSYAKGVLDALRWVNGDAAGEDFAALMGGGHAGSPA